MYASDLLAWKSFAYFEINKNIENISLAIFQLILWLAEKCLAIQVFLIVD